MQTWLIHHFFIIFIIFFIYTKIYFKCGMILYRKLNIFNNNIHPIDIIFCDVSTMFITLLSVLYLEICFTMLRMLFSVGNIMFQHLCWICLFVTIFMGLIHLKNKTQHLHRYIQHAITASIFIDWIGCMVLLFN
jgi:hypothetical protein